MKKSLGPKTLLYPAPVWIIGSYDKNNKPDAMAAAWAGICCSDPACVSVAIRPARQTYANITKKKAFTVNVPSEKYVKQADYFGIASGKTADKFKLTGLTPVKSELVDAPYVKEFPLVAECRLIKILELGAHSLFIGEILDVKADQEILAENGLPDVNKLNTFLFSPCDKNYYKTGSYLAQGYSVGKIK